VLFDLSARDISRRFSKSALFLSSSALCCLPLEMSAQAGPLDNVPFISVYGGYLFNEGNPNFNIVDDTTVDPFFIRPGGDGGMGGFEFGLPLSTGADARISGTAMFFDEATGATSFGGLGGATNSSGEQQLDLQYLDLELGYRPGVMNNLRLFAGPRVLHAGTDAEYDFASTFIGGSKTGSYDHDVNLWAGGARVGAEAALPLGSSGISLSLLGAGSALYAENEHHLSFDQTSTVFGATSGEASDTESRGVYNLEGAAGINLALGRTELELGYQVQQWWNLTTNINNPTAVPGTAGADGKGDFLTHGPMARFTIKLP
jgi:hypothetical protein